jgi:hypothetical protein
MAPLIQAIAMGWSTTIQWSLRLQPAGWSTPGTNRFEIRSLEPLPLAGGGFGLATPTYPGACVAGMPPHGSFLTPFALIGIGNGLRTGEAAFGWPPRARFGLTQSSPRLASPVTLARPLLNPSRLPSTRRRRLDRKRSAREYRYLRLPRSL